MPIYGNIIRVKHDSLEQGVVDVHPSFFRDSFVYQPQFYEGSPYIRRVEFGNRFEHNMLALAKASPMKKIFLLITPLPLLLSYFLTLLDGKFLCLINQTSSQLPGIQ